MPHTYTIRLEVIQTMGLEDATMHGACVSRRGSVQLPLVMRNLHQWTVRFSAESARQ